MNRYRRQQRRYQWKCKLAYKIACTSISSTTKVSTIWKTSLWEELTFIWLRSKWKVWRSHLWGRRPLGREQPPKLKLKRWWGIRWWTGAQIRENPFQFECTWMEFRWLLPIKIFTTDSQLSTGLIWCWQTKKIEDTSSRLKFKFIVSRDEINHLK